MKRLVLNHFKQVKIYACLAVMVFSALLPLKVFAVDYGFYSSNDVLFYDPSACGGSSTVSGTGGPSNGSVVAIGDSLLVNANSSGNLSKKMRSEGKYTDVTVDAQVSRFIYQGGQGTAGNPSSSGIKAIDNNKAKITSAGTIVVVLGTNYDGDFDKGVKEFMTKVRDLNNNAKVYWVNIANTNSPPSADGANKAITKYSTDSKYNYTVVDWHGTVYSGGSADSSLLDSSGYHQSIPKGVNTYASLILDKIGKFGGGSGSGGAGGSVAPMTGSKQDKNAATVWNYLTGKGLSAEQAAGFLGNMQAESGIDPSKEEYGGGGGFGLVQWTGTPGRRTNLENFARQQGKPASDLGMQLDFLWKELNSGYKSNVLEPLKKATTVRAAAVIILLKFEIPKDQSIGVQDDRTGFAEKWFKKFSGFAGTGTADGTNCTCTTDSSGGVSGTKPKILLGPGHTGNDVPISQYNGNPKIKDKIYSNHPELQDVWDVSQIVKTKLEAKGYEVSMTKNSAKGGTYQWNRAQQANDNNVDLALEIHTSSPSGNFGSWGQAWSQLKDGYRIAKDGQKVYSVASDSVIDKSKEYAKKITDARKAAGEPGVVTESQAGFYSAADPPGNTTLVQLWSKVPWVYLEAGADKTKDGDHSGGITDTQKRIYADGIVNGVTASIPSSGGSSNSGCNTSGSGDAAAIVDWALKFAWDDHDGHSISDAKPIYQEWYKKYYSGNDYSACNQFVATVMRASGADSKYDLNGTNDQESNYVKKHPEKYTKVTNIQSTKNLQPGDIFFKNEGGSSGHTWLYVGDQTGGNMREASWGSRPPTANNILSWYTSQSNTTAYRLK